MTFAEERDKAFIDAVVNDKWDKVRKYSKKYGVPIPKKKKCNESRNLQSGSVLHEHSRRRKSAGYAEVFTAGLFTIHKAERGRKGGITWTN